jgi:hypothetical protein
MTKAPQTHLRTSNIQFDLLKTAFSDSREQIEAFGSACEKIKRTIWKGILINIALSLIGVGLSVGVATAAILGVLKLFGVI